MSEHNFGNHNFDNRGFEQLLSEIRNEKVDDRVIAKASERVWHSKDAASGVEVMVLPQ